MDSLRDWLLAGGGTGLLLFIGYRLHSDAVKAERGRADDARAVAAAERKRAELLQEQINILLGRRRGEGE